MDLRSKIMQATHRLGFEVRKYPLHSVYNVPYKRIHIINHYSASVVLDVGANEGQYAEDLSLYGYKGRIVSFEPLPLAYEKLKSNALGKENWQCMNVALGNIDGEIDINISENLVSSSFLGMESAHLEVAPASRYVNTIKVAINRLDSLSQDLIGADKKAYLKIDVQGYQDQVISGALETLSKVVAIEVEMSLVSLYKEEPKMTAFIDRLSSLGFELASLENGFTDVQTGSALQVDGIFVNRNCR